MDFTLKIFQNFLNNFLQNHYHFVSFYDYIYGDSNIKTQFSQFAKSAPEPINNSTSKHLNPSTPKLISLRHDVDRKPENSLKTAILENELGIKGTYYFRVVPESYDLKIMNEIAKLGHEIGYHYEDVDLAIKKLKGKRQKLKKEELIDLAYESFCKNLEMFRKNFEVKTICMHGSPRSKYDNKLIWTKYNYRELGIIGEPYFDIDFNEVAYFTDTGRRWNGHKFSIRDKVNSKYNFDFKTTQNIISNIDKLPPKLMFTIHPERWNDRIIPWTKEFVMQNIKNVVKRTIIYFNNRDNKN